MPVLDNAACGILSTPGTKNKEKNTIFVKHKSCTEMTNVFPSSYDRPLETAQMTYYNWTLVHLYLEIADQVERCRV